MNPLDYPEHSLRRHIAKRYKNLNYLAKKAEIDIRTLEQFMENPSNVPDDIVYNLCELLDFEVTEEEDYSESEWW